MTTEFIKTNTKLDKDGFKELFIDDYQISSFLVNLFWNHYNTTLKILSALKEIKEYATAFGKSYILIRTATGASQQNIVKRIETIFSANEFDFEYYDQKSDFNLDTLNCEPKKTTFVFMKEKCRCSQTLCKEYISVVYERIPSGIKNDDALNQGLMGRMCGYDDNGKTIIYSNISSGNKLIKIDENGFTDMKNFVANTLNRNGTSTGTYNCDNEDVEIEKTTREVKSLILGVDYTFTFKDTAEEAIKFMNEKLHIPRTNNKRKINSDGFLTTRWKNIVAPRTLEDLYQYGATQLRTRGATLGHANPANLYPYYTDITDKTTLKWAVCHYIKDYKD